MKGLEAWRWLLAVLLIAVYAGTLGCGPNAAPDDDRNVDDVGDLDRSDDRDDGDDLVGDDPAPLEGDNPRDEPGGDPDKEVCFGEDCDEDFKEPSCGDGGQDCKEPGQAVCCEEAECKPACSEPGCNDMPHCDEPLDVCKDCYCPKDDSKWCHWLGDCMFENLHSPAARMIAYWIGRRPLFEMELTRDLDIMLLAKAEYDECFAGIGEEYPELEFDDQGEPICPESSRPKRNEAYVWGLTKVKDNLIFGSVANMLCMVTGEYFDIGLPIQTDSWVCEYDQAASGTGDHRPPAIYLYNVKTHDFVDISPAEGSHARDLLDETTGLRAAGAIQGIAFLSGPDRRGGINIFAYNGKTGELLGAETLPEYSDVRDIVTVKEALYVGVAFTQPHAAGRGGAVLRWTGSLDSEANNLFSFEEVGHLDTNAAFLAEHEGRLFVTTWPALEYMFQRFIGLYMSPKIPEGGLTSDHRDMWVEIWNITDYDSDMIAAAGTAGGALASFDGHLYWGTLHAPGVTSFAALFFLDIDMTDPSAMIAAGLGAHRPTSVFRGRDFGTEKQKLQVVYGEKYLPKYDPEKRTYTIARDAEHQNKMLCPTPLWGPSGLGNFFNNYMWTMDVFEGSLYMGTMDFSGVVATFASIEQVGNVVSPFGQAGGVGTFSHLLDYHAMMNEFRPYFPRRGGDLFRVERCDGKAKAVFVDGLGNTVNYGLRTMISDKDALYVGTANPMNLDERGGWEMLRLTRPAHCK